MGDVGVESTEVVAVVESVEEVAVESDGDEEPESGDEGDWDVEVDGVEVDGVEVDGAEVEVGVITEEEVVEVDAGVDMKESAKGQAYED